MNATAPKKARASGPSKLTDHVHFRDAALAARYARRRIPMATLYEAYFDGALDIIGDIRQFIAEREHLVSYQIERRHLQWLVTHFLPEALIHTQRQDTRIVREHYDRGVLNKNLDQYDRTRWVRDRKWSEAAGGARIFGLS